MWNDVLVIFINPLGFQPLPLKQGESRGGFYNKYVITSEYFAAPKYERGNLPLCTLYISISEADYKLQQTKRGCLTKFVSNLHSNKKGLNEGIPC